MGRKIVRRKVRRKVNKKKLKKRAEPADYTGRKYDDYLEFIKNNPYAPTTEILLILSKNFSIKKIKN